MSQNCPPTEDIRLDVNSLLNLECKSSCGPGTLKSLSKFLWVKNSRLGQESVHVLDSHGPTLEIESVKYKDGGTYKCRCLPDGQFCEHNVQSEFPSLYKSPPFSYSTY